MSVHVSSWAWKQHTGGPGPKVVLVKLADNADDSGYCWRNQRRLAEECEVSRRTVQRHLDTLEVLGLMSRIVEPAEGGQRRYGYRLHIKNSPRQLDAGGLDDLSHPLDNGDATPAPLVTQQEPSVEPKDVDDDLEFHELLGPLGLTAKQHTRFTDLDDRERVRAWLLTVPPEGIRNPIGWRVRGVEDGGWPATKPPRSTRSELCPECELPAPHHVVDCSYANAAIPEPEAVAA